MRGSKAFVGHEITESKTIMLVIRFSEQGWILFSLSASLCQDRFTESLRALLCAINYIFKEVCVEHPEVNGENPCQAVCIITERTFQTRTSTNIELWKLIKVLGGAQIK